MRARGSPGRNPAPDPERPRRHASCGRRDGPPLPPPAVRDPRPPRGGRAPPPGRPLDAPASVAEIAEDPEGLADHLEGGLLLPGDVREDLREPPLPVQEGGPRPPPPVPERPQARGPRPAAG